MSLICYPVSFINFTILVTTNCNLRCNHCGHGCNSKNSKTDADLDKIMESTRHLYNLFMKYNGDVKVFINYMGGEPLLYKPLPELLSFTKKECPEFNRDLVTNALAAPTMSTKLIDAIIDNEFQLDITKYPIKGYNYAKLLNYLKSLGIRTHIVETEIMKLKTVKTIPQVQAWFYEHFYVAKPFKSCFSSATECKKSVDGMFCMPIWNEWLFPCTNIFEVFNGQMSDKKYLDIPITNKDKIRVKDITSIEDLLSRLEELFPLCNHCAEAHLREWSTNVKVKLI